MSRSIASVRPRSGAPRAPSVAPKKTRRPPSFATLSGKRPVLGDADFERLREIILDGLGTRTPAAKKALLEARILGRLRHLGLSTFGEYCDLLLSNQRTGREMTTFLDMATINETAFFRERPQLDTLGSEVLPRLLERRRDKDHAVLRVWSAACSNGAEVWTLAMLIDDFRLQTGGAWRFEIVGTDVSGDVLATAAEATYPARSLEPVPQELRRRYVLQSKNKELARICPALRERATFRRVNLMDPAYPVAAQLDLILLRNVLIYFDQATKDDILHKVTAHLRPGGVFCVGLAENLRRPAELGLERIGASRFRKTEP